MKIKSLDDFSSRKEWREYLWNKFIEELLKTKEPQLKNFLDNLLTKKEKDNIIKRLAILSLVRQGKNYREISEALWLSPNTISAVKEGIKNFEYQSYFEISKNKKSGRKKSIKYVQREKLLTAESFWKFIEAIAWFTDDSGIIPPMGKGRWKYLNNRLR